MCTASQRNGGTRCCMPSTPGFLWAVLLFRLQPAAECSLIAGRTVEDHLLILQRNEGETCEPFTAVADSPVVVVGMGGSGTRSMEMMLEAAGVNTGTKLLQNGKPRDLALFLPPLNTKKKNRWFHNLGVQHKISRYHMDVDVMHSLNITLRESYHAQVGIIEKVLEGAHRKNLGTLSWQMEDLDLETQRQLITAGAVLKSVLQFAARTSICGGDYVQWGWKAPRNLFLLPFIKWMFPRARFIHVVRTPFDFPQHSRRKEATDGKACGHLGQASAWLALAPALLENVHYTEHDEPDKCTPQVILRHAQYGSRMWSNATVAASRWGSRLAPENYMDVRIDLDLVLASREDALAVCKKILRFVSIPDTEEIAGRMISHISGKSNHSTSYSKHRFQTEAVIDELLKPWLTKELAAAVQHFKYPVPHHLQSQYDALL